MMQADIKAAFREAEADRTDNQTPEAEGPPKFEKGMTRDQARSQVRLYDNDIIFH